MLDADLAISVVVQVSQLDAAPLDQNDQLARSLLRALRESDFVAELPFTAQQDQGTKSAVALEIGKVLLTLLPATLPKLIDFLNTWVSRKNNGSVKLKLANGTEVEVDGNISPSRVREIIDAAKQGN